MATLAEIDYFDLLSNEVVVNIVGFLDLTSLYRFTSSSKRLYEFKQISNDQWRRYYAQKWLLDDRELAIYKMDDWQKVYFARLKSENDYLLRLKLAQDTPPKGIDGRYWRQPREGTDQDDIYHIPAQDPWAFILRDNNDEEDSTRVKTYFHFIEEFFSSEPFTDEDTKREILSGRFDILVTGLSRYAARDTETLTCFKIFEKFYSASNYYKEKRKRPFGLLGLLAKYLDITLPVHLLQVVTTAMWEVVGSGEVTEDFFVGLDIVPKLITISTKTTHITTKNAALGALTWFKPSKPDNTKVLVNPAFMRVLADMPFGDNLTSNFNTITPLLVVFGQFNMSVVEELRLTTRLIELMRKHSNEPKKLKNLLAVVNAFCIYSEDCCVELAQHDTALEFVMSLITSSKDESIRKVAESALLIIDSVARVGKYGADRLLTLNAMDRLLPFMEDPTNTHLFRHIYTTLHLLNDFASTNGFGEEIHATLLQYKGVLVDRGDDAAAEEVQEACSGFWTNFSCATPPPRDVSIRLIDRTLPKILLDTTKLDVKKDDAWLLGSIAEVDFEAFEGKDVTKLFNYLAEYLINFDSAKEREELLRIEKEKEKEAQLKAGGVAAEVPPKTEENENENHQEDDEAIESYEDIAHSESENMEVDQNEEEEDSMAVDDYIEDIQPDLAKVTESPWPLYPLAYLARFDYAKKIAIQNERLLNKMFSLYEDKTHLYESHYMVIYFFSHIALMPGWNSAKALQCIEEFALKAPVDLEWNFVFSLIEPYAHLLRKDNPIPLVIFGSWIIAHMSTTEPGRQVLKKDLNPDLLKWLKAYPHPKVEYNMTHFTQNMKKKISRHH